MTSRRFAAVVVALVVAVFVGSMMVAISSVSERFRDAATERDALRVENAENREKVAILTAQVETLGEKPDVEPESEPPTVLGPSSTQVRTAVSSLLPLLLGSALDESCGGSCKGKKGEAGGDGTDGVDGTPGADGAPGKDGADGKDGRSVESTQCTDDGWVVTYSDGSTENAGRCRGGGPPLSGDD